MSPVLAVSPLANTNGAFGVPVGNHIVDRANAHICRPSSLDLGRAYVELTDYDSYRVKRHGITFRALSRLTEVAGCLRDLGTSDASVGATPGGRI